MFQCSQSYWSLEKPIAKQPHTVLATPAVITVKFWSQIPILARLLSAIRLRGDKWATAICRRRWDVSRLTPDWSLLLRWLQNLTSVFFPTGWKIWILCIMPQLRPAMSNYDIIDEVIELGPVCTHLDIVLPSIWLLFGFVVHLYTFFTLLQFGCQTKKQMLDKNKTNKTFSHFCSSF